MAVSYSERDSVWAPPNKAVDDQGAEFDRIQSAVDNASDTVLVGPGTFREEVTINTQGLSIRGVGRGTHIVPKESDGTTVGNGDCISPEADDITVENMRLEGVDNAIAAGARSGSTLRSLKVSSENSTAIVTGDNAQLIDIRVDGTGADAITANADSRIDDCEFLNVTDACVQPGAPGVVVADSTFVDPGGDGVSAGGSSGDRMTVVGCVFSSTGSAGAAINFGGSDQTAVGNSMEDWSGVTRVNTSGATNEIIRNNSPQSVNDHSSMAGQNLQDDGSGALEGTDARIYRQRGDPSTSELADGEIMLFNSDGSGTGSAGDLVYAVNNGGTIETLILAQVSNAT